jgi:A/G-specific adenine glycosylase
MLRETMAEQRPSREGEGKTRLAAKLLAWYDQHRRDLPWRTPPGAAADPYRVWISEIMLQQTTVAAVKNYYRAFITRWPAVASLAAAPLDDVLKAWAGLGYYARARNLHACAKAIVEQHDGAFPDTEETLRALPGIGRYTAAAIAAIAFDRRAAAMDGNAERVVARLFAIEAPKPKARPDMRERLLEMVPDLRSGDFAQAVMDLGAEICTPGRPNCLICPWLDDCEGRRLGIADRLPLKPDKKPLPVRVGVAFWVERHGEVLLQRRPDKGLLGGMIEVPSTPWREERPRDPARSAPVRAKWDKSAGRIEHTFTHFHLELDVWRAKAILDDGSKSNACQWVALRDLASEALPSVMRKVVAAASRTRGRQTKVR